MSRRLSTSTSGFTSSAAQPYEERHSSRSVSGSSAMYANSADTYPSGHSSVDPDELFAKHTVLEVKAVQQKLRADADAKQEELRLMVGERYRDLLQASTSIISLAQSSQRISEAFEEVNDAILSQKEPSVPRRTALSAPDDKDLHSLQSLAVHMKLLLDAPEHLWRFIERKEYFSAAWLFLLARVVHRALIQNDDQEDDLWTEQGVDVSSEFPLVERQWDIVSQFRSQIIHKATLSLREVDSSPEDVCSILITLHLLDSRPLSETFSAMLSQRSKALHTSLHQERDQDNANLTTYPPVTARDTKRAIEKAVVAISRTVGTSRCVFAEDDSVPSMAKQVLRFIHSDSVKSDELEAALPPQLCLTSQSLLITLMSSAQISLLPQSLTTYKPYVDLNSSSSSISASLLSQELDCWFRSSIKNFQERTREWLLHVQAVKDVWNIRMSTRLVIWRSELTEQERLQLLSVWNNSCQERIVAIWESMLLESSRSFNERLTNSISSLKNGINEETGDDLFISMLLPGSPFILSNSSSGGPSFQKYAAGLKKQLVGRSFLLDGILSILEQCAKTIQQDLAEILKVDDESTSDLPEVLVYKHRPSADSISKNVLDLITTHAEGIGDDESSAVEQLAFLAHIAYKLSNSSTFVARVGCSDGGIREFEQHAMSVFKRIIDRWRNLVVTKCLLGTTCLQQAKPSNTVSGPSPQMVQALLTLCQAILKLELSRNSVQRQELAQSCLFSFIAIWMEKDRAQDKQNFFDLLFLRQLLDTERDSGSQTRASLNAQIDMGIWSTDERKKVENTIGSYISRTRTLFDALLPTAREADSGYDKSAFRIVQNDTPSSDQNFDPALELAKPGPRFGLLLVGNY